VSDVVSACIVLSGLLLSVRNGYFLCKGRMCSISLTV
jgi:hypothetical protein